MKTAYRRYCVCGSNTNSKGLLGIILRELWRKTLNKILLFVISSMRSKTHFLERKAWEEHTPKHGETWSGFCGPEHQDSFCLHLESHNTVFQEEIVAINSCAEETIGAGRKKEIIWICFDSREAPRAIGKNRTCFTLVMVAKASLREPGQDNPLNLTWIPGHSGWYRNEEADTWTKQGGYTQCPIVDDLHRTEWQVTRSGSRTKALQGDTEVGEAMNYFPSGRGRSDWYWSLL